MRKKLLTLLAAFALLLGMVVFVSPAYATVGSCGSGYVSLGEDTYITNGSGTIVGTIHAYYIYDSLNNGYVVCAMVEKAPIISGKASYTGVWIKYTTSSTWQSWDTGNFAYYAGPVYLEVLASGQCTYIYGLVTDYSGHQSSNHLYSLCWT